MASREELLQSIRQGMKLDKSFFLKIYGFEISFPGFATEAIKALEDAGCSKAQEYYNAIIGEYQDRRYEELKPVARAIRQRWEEDWKRLQGRSEESRKQEITKDLQNLTERELTELCKTLLQKGIITSPEQFAMAVGLE